MQTKVGQLYEISREASSYAGYYAQQIVEVQRNVTDKLCRVKAIDGVEFDIPKGYLIPLIPSECECGAEKAKAMGHATWCPKYVDPWEGK